MVRIPPSAASLTATLTATPANFGEPWRTLANPGEPLRTLDPGRHLQNERWRTVANAGERCPRELQNRWSASLAMSTDGSFPSLPRQIPISDLMPGRSNRFVAGKVHLAAANPQWPPCEGGQSSGRRALGSDQLRRQQQACRDTNEAGDGQRQDGQRIGPISLSQVGDEDRARDCRAQGRAQVRHTAR